MSHLSILPILIPMLAGALLLMLPSLERLKRSISVLATLALVPLALVLMARADDGQLQVYALGAGSRRSASSCCWTASPR